MIKQCKLCGKEFKPDRKEQIFCSTRCLGISQKTGILRNCIICGKEFYEKKSELYRKYCSRRCFWSSLKGKPISPELLRAVRTYRGEKHPNWKGGKYLKCPVCGKNFWALPSKIKIGRKHCSWKCRKMGRTKQIRCICKTCKKVFYKRYSQVKRTSNNFCSLSCSAIYRKNRFPKANTSIERKVAKWLDDLEIKYTQQELVEGICRPDFLLDNKTIVQCDGSYWHSLFENKNRDVKQDFLLGFKGYKILRLKETDINNHPRKCINMVKGLIQAY